MSIKTFILSQDYMTATSIKRQLQTQTIDRYKILSTVCHRDLLVIIVAYVEKNQYTLLQNLLQEFGVRATGTLDGIVYVKFFPIVSGFAYNYRDLSVRRNMFQQVPIFYQNARHCVARLSRNYFEYKV